MELFVLDRYTYERLHLISEYESLIWTERFSAHGDFELRVQPTSTMKTQLRIGGTLQHNESNRLMRIEDVEISQDREGIRVMRVTGRSMEAVLDDRGVYESIDQVAGRSYIRRGTIEQTITWLVNHICTPSTPYVYPSEPRDVIPELTCAFPSLTTEEDVLISDPENSSLYDRVKKLCDSADLGFRITFRKTSPKLIFTVYRGVNRPNVVFSSQLDNLTSEAYLSSRKPYKNVVYAWGKKFSSGKAMVVTRRGTNHTMYTGLDRQVLSLVVEEATTSLSSEDYAALLRQRAYEALAEHRHTVLFDGEVAENTPFKYNRDYYLGDTVSFMDRDGNKYSSMVTEYIWSADKSGLKSYPTFSVSE